MAVAIYLKYVKATEPFGGAIVLVGTPIGNLGDISKRALDTLEEADLICCEDTRRTRKLLSSAGITGKKLVTMASTPVTTTFSDLPAAKVPRDAFAVGRFSDEQ